MGSLAAPVPASSASGHPDQQQLQARIYQLQYQIEQLQSQVAEWLRRQGQATFAPNIPVTPQVPQLPQRVASGQMPSGADPLAIQIHQMQRDLSRLQRELLQAQQQILEMSTNAARASSVPDALPAPVQMASPPAAPATAMRVALPQQKVQQAQQPRVIRLAIPYVSTAVLPKRVMHPVVGQPPSFRESLLSILLICVLFLFVVTVPVAAVVIMVLGIAGTLLSALLQPALPILLIVSIGIVVVLLFLAWLALLLEMRNQFRTLTQAFRTSTRAIKNRRKFQPQSQREQSDDSDAHSLAQEPPGALRRETLPLPEVATEGDSTRLRAAPGGVVGWGERVEAAQWERRPKEDLNDPVPDSDLIALPQNKSRGQWAVIGSSRIGRSHEYDGKYREDSLGAAIVGYWQVAAVADGGGSYKMARVGARVATEAATTAMKQQIEHHKGSVPMHQEVPTVIATVLTAGIRAAYQAIYNEAVRRNDAGEQITVKDLRTTLLLLVHCESHKPKGHWVGGMQVGDGIVVARDGKDVLHWLGTPDTGPSGNEVLFLTDAPDTDEEWERRKCAVFIEDEPLHCLAMTDGVSDDFLPVDKNLGSLEKPLYSEVLRKQSPHDAAQALDALISYDRNGSFDDRTVVCIYKVR
jgi:hypothetical protein